MLILHSLIQLSCSYYIYPDQMTLWNDHGGFLITHSSNWEDGVLPCTSCFYEFLVYNLYGALEIVIYTISRYFNICPFGWGLKN